MGYGHMPIIDRIFKAAKAVSEVGKAWDNGQASAIELREALVELKHSIDGDGTWGDKTSEPTVLSLEDRNKRLVEAAREARDYIANIGTDQCAQWCKHKDCKPSKEVCRIHLALTYAIIYA